MSDSQTLYAADYLITQNDARDIIEQAALVVQGNRIVSVGHRDLLEVMFPDAAQVQLGKAVLMPGLINAHSHAAMTLMRGYADDHALQEWLFRYVFPANGYKIGVEPVIRTVLLRRHLG